MTYGKLGIALISILLIGFLAYEAAYLDAPRSLHGPYAVTCTWQHWALAKQPVQIVVLCPPAAICHPSAQPYITGRLLQIGPVHLIHEAQ